jgi:uncharacterized protein
VSCPHRFALWLAGTPPSEKDDEGQALLYAKGFEHESAVLERLEQTRKEAAVRIPTQGIRLDERIRLTRQAMEDGSALIYQGALATGRWIGFPDFLVREGSCDSRNYRPEDAKLSRIAKHHHVLQIGVYAELLKRTTGAPIRKGVIHTSAEEAEIFDLTQTEYVTAQLMRRLDEFAALESRSTRALRCPACATCEYKSRCENEWRERDSPIFVAGLRIGQMLKLEAAGIQTMSELAKVGHGIRVKGIGEETLPKLAAQARLQKGAEMSGAHCVEVLPVQGGRGFALLPPPNPGDLFLDLEGDPFYPGGLEYLIGLLGPLDDSGERVYRSFWAHGPEEEKTAFQDVMTLIFATTAAHKLGLS